MMALSVPMVLDWGILREESEHDEELNKIRSHLLKEEDSHPDYLMVGQKLLYRGDLCFPRHLPTFPIYYRSSMTLLFGGHSGVQKTYRRLTDELHWVGMQKDVEKMVVNCDIYQRHKYLAVATRGLLQPLALLEKVWEEVIIDFIERPPRSEGFTVILVVVDSLSKYVYFIPLYYPYTRTSVTAAFIKEVVCLYVIPESIMSD